MEYIKEIETFSIYHFIVNYPKKLRMLTISQIHLST